MNTIPSRIARLAAIIHVTGLAVSEIGKLEPQALEQEFGDDYRTAIIRQIDNLPSSAFVIDESVYKHACRVNQFFLKHLLVFCGYFFDVKENILDEIQRYLVKA